MRQSLWILPAILIFISCNKPEKKEIPDFLAANIDSTISPASDFFLYANGGWIKKCDTRRSKPLERRLTDKSRHLQPSACDQRKGSG